MVRSVTLLTTVVAALLGTACTKKEPQPGEDVTLELESTGGPQL